MTSPHTAPALRPDPSEIARALDLLWRRRSRSSRGPHPPHGTRRELSAGTQDTANAGQGRYPAQRKLPAVYVSLNPVNPDLLARANNRLKVHVQRNRQRLGHRVPAPDPDRLRPQTAQGHILNRCRTRGG